MVTLRYTARSHPGLVREHNEDAHVVGPRLLAVADGVGGEAAGEVASGLAIETLSPLTGNRPVEEPETAALRAVDEANNNIGVSADENPDQRGMATTLTMLYLTEESILLVHAGDSRAYRCRAGELLQLSKDDSYIQALLDEGALTPAEAAEHPYRSVVTKVLQGYPMEPTSSTWETELGDRYLVCSDGLSDVVSDVDIAAALRDHETLTDAADKLVELALEAGGPDNVTVVLGEVVEAGGLRDRVTSVMASIGFS